MSSAEAPSAAVRTMIPPPFGSSFLHDLLEARALRVLESARDARPLAVRDVDEEAAGQRDLGREPCALRLHRILDGLDHERLAALDQILDLPRALASLELGADDLVDVEEPVLLEADLDERGLHSREDVVDDAEVDVPGDRAALRSFEVDLCDAVVLEDRDALLADVDRDHELALRGRKRRALGRRTSAPLRRAAAGARGLAVGCLARLLRACAEPEPRPEPQLATLLDVAVGIAEAVVGFFFPRPPRLPRRRLFFGPVGESSAGLRATCCLAEPQAVLLPPRQRVPPLPVRPASCQSETSVMPRVRSPRSVARGPRSSHRRARPRAAWIQDCRST